ncbi:MAG: tRNA pseudouridine(38-40) synthase TruA [Erysipelotrichaceae bacterium]|nr:tRNA pseudouridine(38-40) synthase TruA [Erysipelotrichaceae bacterium]MDD3809906.1 tRNA pseudouridine(38-40) synthase TruA [Erysipelotrichaceae bacterium]
MRIKCTVSYDGSKFKGWQIQNNQRTIQGEIQAALKNITQEPIAIHGSGRTDGKVHGRNQVFHFDCSKELSENRWHQAINHFLPNDVYVKQVELVNEEFHSRYSAKSKEYRYYVNIDDYDPFKTNYIYQLNKPLDLQLMQEGADIFVGEHDFASFCALDQLGTTIRSIYEFEITQSDGIVCFRVLGNGFRRYMVRHLVGALIQVGQKRLPLERVKQMLESKGEIRCLHKAKPQGLYLQEVHYD